MMMMMNLEHTTLRTLLCAYHQKRVPSETTWTEVGANVVNVGMPIQILG